jgi:hypothetical protein
MILWCNGTTDILQKSTEEPVFLDETPEALRKMTEVKELIKE